MNKVFLLDTIYDFSKNDFQTKKYVVMKTIEISRITYFKKAIKSTILSLPNYKDWLTNNHLFNSNEHTYKISFSKN